MTALTGATATEAHKFLDSFLSKLDAADGTTDKKINSNGQDATDYITNIFGEGTDISPDTVKANILTDANTYKDDSLTPHERATRDFVKNALNDPAKLGVLFRFSAYGVEQNDILDLYNAFQKAGYSDEGIQDYLLKNEGRASAYFTQYYGNQRRERDINYFEPEDTDAIIAAPNNRIFLDNLKEIGIDRNDIINIYALVLGVSNKDDDGERRSLDNFFTKRVPPLDYPQSLSLDPTPTYEEAYFKRAQYTSGIWKNAFASNYRSLNITPDLDY